MLQCSMMGHWHRGAEEELKVSVLGEVSLCPYEDVSVNRSSSSGAQDQKAPSPCSDDSSQSESGFHSVTFR